MAPAGGEGEVVVGHVAAVGGGGDGDGGDIGAEGGCGDAGDGGVGVEELGEFAAAGGGGGQLFGGAVAVAIGPGGEGDAGPLHAQRAGVGDAVGGVVEDGEDVVEEVLDAEAEGVEVARGGGGKVGAAAVVRVEGDVVAAQPDGEAGCASIHQIKAADV